MHPVQWWHVRSLVIAVTAHCLIIGPADASDEATLDQARVAFARDDFAEAVESASHVIDRDSTNVEARVLRARAHVALRQPETAVADFDAALRLKPERAELYNARGSARFQAGDVAGSIDDFDHYIKMRPAEERGHWKRGISYYYAGQFDKGRRQFEAYQTFDDNDVENAVWRYLCTAREVNVEEARQTLLKIKADRRVPMMKVYDLFAGRATPDNVLAAARSGDPTAEQLNERLFYAHLYIGLYHEAAGDEDLARRHITRAATRHLIAHYMWDVARVHADRLAKKPN